MRAKITNTNKKKRLNTSKFLNTGSKNQSIIPKVIKNMKKPANISMQVSFQVIRSSKCLFSIELLLQYQLFFDLLQFLVQFYQKCIEIDSAVKAI